MKPSAKNKLRYVFSRRFYPLKEENENKNFNKYKLMIQLLKENLQKKK